MNPNGKYKGKDKSTSMLRETFPVTAQACVHCDPLKASAASSTFMQQLHMHILRGMSGAVTAK